MVHNKMPIVKLNVLKKIKITDMFENHATRVQGFGINRKIFASQD